MNLTIYDISELSGVSIATVSRVLNNSPKVSEKTKQKVLAVMEQNNYKPNIFARGLGLNTSQTIGILCTGSLDSIQANAVYQLETRLRAENYNTILSFLEENQSLENGIELLCARKVEALILLSPSFDTKKESEYTLLQQTAQKLPLVLFQAEYDCPNIYCIRNNDKDTFLELTTNLITKGSRHPLFLYHPACACKEQKLAGFRQAVLNNLHRIKGHEVLCYTGALDHINEITNFLTKNEYTMQGVDSVLACDDILAIGALKYASQNHFSVPKDFAVTGCGNSILTQCCEPPLSCIDIRLDLLCEAMVSTLINVLNGTITAKGTVIKSEFVKRGSTL